MTATKISDTYDNTELQSSHCLLIVDCRAVAGFVSLPNMIRKVKKIVSEFQANCVTMFYVIEYVHLDC